VKTSKVKLLFDQDIMVINLHYGHSPVIIMFIVLCSPGVSLRVKLEAYHTYSRELFGDTFVRFV